jgi:DNA-binding NtrC family response regulator
MKLRALIFEDNEDLLSLIISIFEERDYEVFGFSQAGSCPLFLKQDCPCPFDYVCADIIITDINMPGVNGLDFIENQLHQGCKAKNIIVMSGAWSSKEIKKAQRLKVQIFQKPIRIDKFIKFVKRIKKRVNPERKLSDWFLLKEIK